MIAVTRPNHGECQNIVRLTQPRLAALKRSERK
jgi:hypothetical protein